MMDPFVGTGSCLVPAAHLGAYTIGTDIDVRVIKLGEWLVVQQLELNGTCAACSCWSGGLRCAVARGMCQAGRRHTCCFRC